MLLCICRAAPTLGFPPGILQPPPTHPLGDRRAAQLMPAQATAGGSPPMGRGVWLPTGWTGTGSPCRRSVTGIARVTGSCFRGGCPWSSWKSGAEEERRIGRWPRGWPLFRLRIRAHACQTGPAGRQTNDIRVCLAASMGTTEPPLPRTESLIVSVVSEKLDEDFALVDDVEAVVSWLSDISSLAPILQVPIADGYELFFEPC